MTSCRICIPQTLPLLSMSQRFKFWCRRTISICLERCMKEIVIKTKKQKKGLEIVILCLVEVNYLYLRTWSQKLAIVFKKLMQNFVLLFSVITNLWRYKVLNTEWVTSYSLMYKTIHPWFSLHIFVNFWNFSHYFMVVLWSCEVLND